MSSTNRQYKVILFILIIVLVLILVVVSQSSFEVVFCFHSYGICRDPIRFDETPQCPNTVSRILTVSSDGRLGNKIWEYMSLLAFQKFYFSNGTIFFPSKMKKQLQNVFDSIDHPIISDIPESCIRGVHTKKIGLMENPKPFNFSQNNLKVLLHNYSCRYTDVLNYGLENIKQKLRFHQKWIDKGTQVLRNIKSSFGFNDTDNVTFIGVHYRGGDYNTALRNVYSQKFVGPPSFLYYRNAMNYFKNTTKNPIFVFSTIDNKWAAQNLRYLQNFNTFKLHPAGTVEDLVTLSVCNHSIINYGTYSTTAALFSNGTTFVYDLKLPNDGRGYTLASNMAKVIPNWFLCDNNSSCIPKEIGVDRRIN